MAGSGGLEADGALGVVLGVGSPLGLGDGALVERFVTRPGSVGGEAAFEALVARHGAMVRRVCRQTLRSEADADDAYQAVFLVLARRAGSIRDPDLLAPWLYGVALRTARLARLRRRVVAGLVDEPVADRLDGCPVEGAEAAEALHAEVARLPEAQRRAVVLCHWQGLTHDEAARRLGVPTGTVSVRLMRARDRLRLALTRRGFAPGAPLLPALPRVEAIPPRAWAALSHLRGIAAGEVPVGVASLASGALAMTPNVLKIAALALLSTGLAITGAWILAQGPVQPVLAQKPPTAPLPANKPATPPVENPDLAEFRRVYRLEPGQVLKRIPPPFAPSRMAGLRSIDPQNPAESTTISYFQRGDILSIRAQYFRGDPVEVGLPLLDFIRELVGTDFPAIEGPDDLLLTALHGDWITKLPSSPAERIVALDTVLRDDCKLPIRVRMNEQDRDVIVVRGSFDQRPVIAGNKRIQIYGATIVLSDGPTAGWNGPLDLFFQHLARFMTPHRSLVNETGVSGDHRCSWQENARTPATEQTTREDRDPDTVLRHVAEQTGLTFTTERRRVPVITVERAE